MRFGVPLYRTSEKEEPSGSDAEIKLGCYYGACARNRLALPSPNTLIVFVVTLKQPAAVFYCT